MKRTQFESLFHNAFIEAVADEQKGLEQISEIQLRVKECLERIASRKIKNLKKEAHGKNQSRFSQVFNGVLNVFEKTRTSLVGRAEMEEVFHAVVFVISNKEKLYDLMLPEEKSEFNDLIASLLSKASYYRDKYFSEWLNIFEAEYIAEQMRNYNPYVEVRYKEAKIATAS